MARIFMLVPGHETSSRINWMPSVTTPVTTDRMRVNCATADPGRAPLRARRCPEGPELRDTSGLRRATKPADPDDATVPD